MEQMNIKDEQDYIDIPAFIRSLMRYARRYLLLAVPLIICMTAALAVLSRPYGKKTYVAGGTCMVGVRLTGSLDFDYNLSGLSWDRQATLVQMTNVLSALKDSGYIDQFVKDAMGKKQDEALNGLIYINSAYSTNLVDVSVASDSLEDARAIRDALLTCLPDAVLPAVGFIEMDVQETYDREEVSPRAFLTSRAVWAAGGIALGIFGYLGLVFLYTLTRRDVESPEDLRKLTDLPCLGKLPALRKKAQYQAAFTDFRRTVAEEIREHQIRVILLTGEGKKKGQTTIAAAFEKDWQGMGKKVLVTDLKIDDGPMTEAKVRAALDQYLKDADLVLIDGPACGESADPLILADCADAVVMVIREGASQPEELREMFQSLQYVKARPLGYVLSRCSNI